MSFQISHLNLSQNTSPQETLNIFQQTVTSLKAGEVVIMNLNNRMYICLVDGNNSEAVEKLIALKGDPDKILSHMIVKRELAQISNFPTFFARLPIEAYSNAIWRTQIKPANADIQSSFCLNVTNLNPHLFSTEGIQASSIELIPSAGIFLSLCSKEQVCLVGSSANFHGQPTIIHDQDIAKFLEQVPGNSLVVKVQIDLPVQDQKVKGSLSVFKVLDDNSVETIRKAADYDPLVAELKQIGFQVIDNSHAPENESSTTNS